MGRSRIPVAVAPCSGRCGTPVTPRTSSVARSATSLLGRPAADWDLASDARPDRLLELFPGAVYENRFGTVGVRRDGRGLRDHHLPAATTTTPTSGDPTGSSSATRSSSTWPAATSPSTPWPGARAAAGEPAPAGGPVRRPGRRRRRGRFGRSASRVAAVRGGRAADGARRPAGGHARVRDRAGDAGRDRGSSRARRGTCRASGSRRSCDKLLGAPTPSVGLRLMRDTGLLAPISPELAAQRGIAAEQGPGRGPLGPHRCGPSTPRRSPGPSFGWPRCSTTSASRRPSPTGHFLGHDTVGARLAGGVPRPAARRRARSASGWSRSSATTCSATKRTGRTPRSAGSSARSAALGTVRSTSCSTCARRTTSGRGLPAGAGRLDELRGADRGGTGRRRRPRPARAGDRRGRPDDRARTVGRGRCSAAFSTSCSSGSSSTPG